MMGIKNEIDKHQIEMFSLEQLVPENHLVRKINKAIDLSFVRSLVANLYVANVLKELPKEICRNRYI